jgi:hypothetical protein
MRRVSITVFCILCCTITFTVGCEKAGQPGLEYTITDAYKYPVEPGMEEWKKLNSLQEKAEACQIPVDILGSMTTEALIETVVNYPLFINVFAYDNKKTGLEHVKGYFNGLQELYQRDDAIEKMENYIGEKFKEVEDRQPEKFKKMFAEFVLNNLKETLNNSSN